MRCVTLPQARPRRSVRRSRGSTTSGHTREPSPERAIPAAAFSSSSSAAPTSASRERMPRTTCSALMRSKAGSGASWGKEEGREERERERERERRGKRAEREFRGRERVGGG